MSSKALAQTQDKALQLNLASTIYGTFAEIGAGQETANWFFRASGAAGTVAKTISAYDMTVSDTLYGPVKRYVLRRYFAPQERWLRRQCRMRADSRCFPSGLPHSWKQQPECPCRQ